MAIVTLPDGRQINIPDNLAGFAGVGGREPTIPPGGIQTVTGAAVPAGGFVGTGLPQPAAVNPALLNQLGPIDTGAGSLQTGGFAGGIGTTIPGQIPGAAATFPPTPVSAGQAFIPGSATNPPVVPQVPAPALPAAPPTGLIGGEQALLTGLEASIGGLEQGITQGVGAIQGGTQQALQQLATGQQPLQQFADPGIQAQQQQAALSGALGPQAQQAAFDAFTASPGQQFLQQEAERSLLRNQGAIGGLGGGNVRRALQEQAIGLGQQFFQQGFENLGQVATRGLQGAQGVAQLAGQGAGFAQQGGIAQGQLLGQAGLTAAGIAQRTGQDIAQQRFQTGRDIANAVSGTTSALSGLAETQGAGLADITGGGAVNIANLLSGFGQLDAASQQALGVLLSNLATQQGTQTAILGQQIGQATAAGITGQAAGLRTGIGQAAGALTGFQTGGLSGVLGSFIPPAT